MTDDDTTANFQNLWFCIAVKIKSGFIPVFIRVGEKKKKLTGVQKNKSKILYYSIINIT